MVTSGTAFALVRPSLCLMTSRAFPPAVAWVPGFFDFDDQGETTYFAARFVSGLRCVLDTRGLSGVSVLSVSTLSIGSLAKRQRDPLHDLRALETASKTGPHLGAPRTWHPVGHSSGGADAALLLRDSPLAGGNDAVAFAAGGWGEAAELVARITSVTALAAPHFGTGLEA